MNRAVYLTFRDAQIVTKLEAAGKLIERARRYEGDGKFDYAEGCLRKARKKIKAAEALGWKRPSRAELGLEEKRG